MEFKNDNEKALNLEGTLFIHFLMSNPSVFGCYQIKTI